MHAFSGNDFFFFLMRKIPQILSQYVQNFNLAKAPRNPPRGGLNKERGKGKNVMFYFLCLTMFSSWRD